MQQKKSLKIFLAGHKGMVGSAIERSLIRNGYRNIITKSKAELDLTNQNLTFKFLNKLKPNFVILSAAKVGGISLNAKFKHEFIYENTQIQNNVIHGSYLAGTKNLFFLSSSCIYPKLCKQPMKEKYLLSGPLEETNEAYSLAKISGIKMCEYYSSFFNVNFKSLVPPNLYGPNDNFDLTNSHFYPALLKKIFLAKKNNKKSIKIWGNGKAKRELMFVDDFADAVIFFMKKKIKEPYINIGNGKDYEINWFARMLMKNMKIKLNIAHDYTKPNGMPRKCLDISLAKKYGWKPENDYIKGFEITYKNFISKKKNYEK